MPDFKEILSPPPYLEHNTFEEDFDLENAKERNDLTQKEKVPCVEDPDGNLAFIKRIEDMRNPLKKFKRGNQAAYDVGLRMVPQVVTDEFVLSKAFHGKYIRQTEGLPHFDIDQFLTEYAKCFLVGHEDGSTANILIDETGDFRFIDIMGREVHIVAYFVRKNAAGIMDYLFGNCFTTEIIECRAVSLAEYILANEEDFYEYTIQNAELTVDHLPSLRTNSPEVRSQLLSDPWEDAERLINDFYPAFSDRRPRFWKA